MHAGAHAARRWIALVAATLFVFQALIASAVLAAPRTGAGAPGATTIICTASGPRVVTLDADGAKPAASQHSGALPHCCSGGCAMLGGATPPMLFLLAWLLPAAPPQGLPRSAPAPHFSSALARLPQRSRAPPVLV
ncbi:DUF2946 family protein [Achromobacter deleyi]|uniref:DUF2946 family protein n=1 Tax=Achromobacter deleyi TaxID=1353891 RepID=UPI001467BF1D|nr:DUF2946 family protein [Achromobacter deleyi]CAB3887951.1 hypothetical protein LMG3412_03602 [Achromobacter deleyi]